MRYRRFTVWGALHGDRYDRGQSGSTAGGQIAPRMILSIHPTGVYHPTGIGRGNTTYVAALAQPVPLATAEMLRERLQASFSCGGMRLSQARRRGFRTLRRKARRLLDAWYGMDQTGQLPGPILWAHDQEDQDRSMVELLFPDAPGTDGGVGSVLTAAEDEIREHVVDLLATRALLTDEIQRALTERGIPRYDGLDQLLDPLVHDGSIVREAGVRGRLRFVDGAWTWTCARCGSQRVRLVPCHRCGWEQCPRCVGCDALGPVTGCAPLYHAAAEREDGGGLEGEEEPQTPVTVALPFTLSRHQQAVSKALAQDDGDALIWAACGSGKTESVLKTIAAVVTSGGRVLFALPRRDAVIELGQRLTEALPGADVVVLTGETPQRYGDAALVVATVHQALRFRGAFDLIIVDEVDAFPLNREPHLLTTLQRARRADGRIIMMTATPSEALVDRIDGRRLVKYTLPGRPHGHPLPIPRSVCHPAMSSPTLHAQEGSPESGPRAKDRWPALLTDLTDRSVAADRRVLVFVPSVRTGSIVRQVFSAAAGADRHPGKGRAAFVHAGDPKRQEMIRAFAAGDLDILISTTILERGITLPFLDVVVFSADQERVFDAATLIQMAGRVGRRVEDPSGSVVFLAARSTPAMDEAIETVVKLNALSARVGDEDAME